MLNLKQASNYRAQLQGNALLLILDPAATPAAVASADQPVHFAPARRTSSR